MLYFGMDYRELDNSVRTLSTDKKNVMHQLEDASQRISRLKDQNRDYENEVSDLTAQLASSLEAREMAAKKAAHR